MKQKPNPLRDQTYEFALEIVRFCMEMQERREYVISRQLLKSGTSIGANVEEALHAESRADFIHKLSIALKEAHESNFWLRLIFDSQCDPNCKTAELRRKLHAIISLLTRIIKSTKENMATKKF